MSVNLFLEKYHSKPNSQLEQITRDSKTYVLDARKAASIILKNRNSNSQAINAVENEIQEHNEQLKNIALRETYESNVIIKKLREIPKNITKRYELKNGNELEIRRINEFIFEVRIEAFRSSLAPVMICKIIDESTFKTFPFIYIKGFLIFGIGGSLVAFILSQFYMINSEIIPLPILISLGFQLILSPLYYVILKFFKETLGSIS